MKLLGMMRSKTNEALLTDAERRKTYAEVAKTKSGLDEQFASLSRLVDAALVELKDRRAKPPLHPKTTEN